MVATEQLLLLAGLGVGGYVLLNRDVPHTGSGTSPPPSTATPTRTKNFATIKRSVSTAIAKGAAQVVRKKPSGTTGTGSGSGLPKEVEDKILQDMKKQWENATGEAKRAICERLNSQYNTGLDCSKAPSMEFQALVSVTGAAIGAAVCGPPCSVVGAMVAAWAGPKLEEWANDAWDKVKDWGEEILPWNW